MSSVRTQRLHELVDKALDNTITSLGGAKEFARCFAVPPDAQECLEGRYEEAIVSFRANAKVRTADRPRDLPCARRGEKLPHAARRGSLVRDRAASRSPSSQAEVRKTLDETKLTSDLKRLDALISQQPQLNDGSRWCGREG
jgi:hypothetical protein